MPKKVVLVSCVIKKRAIPSPARDMYISDLFTKSTRYANQITDEWYILSANYRLKAKGITQKAFAESIGMNPRHSTAVKSSKLRNHNGNIP